MLKNQEESKNGNRKKKNVRDVSIEELEKTAGGSFIDDVSCFFGSHTWPSVPTQTKGCGKVPHIYFRCYKCQNCDKIKYVKNNTKTGETITITKEEFDKARF